LSRALQCKLAPDVGATDTQHVLPNGSPADVRAEVRKRFGDLAPGGGYVFSAVHNTQPGVPLENILAMFEAANDYSRYPIDETGQAPALVGLPATGGNPAGAF